MQVRSIFLLLAILWAVHSGQAQNSPSRLPYVQIVIIPSHADWNYLLGEEAVVEVRALRHGVLLENATFSYEIGADEMPPEIMGTVSAHNGVARIEVGTMSVSGFRQCIVRLEYAGKEYSDYVKLGFSPERIEPVVTMPDGFSAYWQEAIEVSNRIPLNPRVVPLPGYSTETTEVSLVQLDSSVPGQYIYGYLCQPRGEGKFPVLLNPPGAGVKRIMPTTEYAEAGFITFILEVHGILPIIDPNEYNLYAKLRGNYMYEGWDDRNYSPYKRIVTDCLRAVDYLCTLPGFDGKNVLAAGGSQGGALSISTAALHPRVTALSAFYPAMCDMRGYLSGRAGGWPGLFKNGAMSNYTPEEVVKTTAYYDIANFARLIRVPRFYSFGYNDRTCPPTSVYTAINQITAHKEVVIEPITGHWRFAETDRQSIEWLKARCRITEND